MDSTNYNKCGVIESVSTNHTFEWRCSDLYPHLLKPGDMMMSPSIQVTGPAGGRVQIMLLAYGLEGRVEGFACLALFVGTKKKEKIFAKFLEPRDDPVPENYVEYFGISLVQCLRRTTLPSDLVVQAIIVINNPDHKAIPVLLQDLRKLQLSGDFSDFKIKVEDKVFDVHKNLLSTRSTYFSALFKNPTKEAKEGALTIEDFPKDVVQELINFIYQGTFNTQEPEDIILAADKYGLEELKTRCAEEMQTGIKASNFCKRLKVAAQLDLSDVQLACLISAPADWAAVVDSEEFTELLTNHKDLAKQVLENWIADKSKPDASN